MKKRIFIAVLAAAALFMLPGCGSRGEPREPNPSEVESVSSTAPPEDIDPPEDVDPMEDIGVAQDAPEPEGDVAQPAETSNSKPAETPDSKPGEDPGNKPGDEPTGPSDGFVTPEDPVDGGDSGQDDPTSPPSGETQPDQGGSLTDEDGKIHLPIIPA